MLQRCVVLKIVAAIKEVLLTVRATTRSGYMMTSPTFAKWHPRRETRGKVTSRLFAAPRSDFRQ